MIIPCKAMHWLHEELLRHSTLFSLRSRHWTSHGGSLPGALGVLEKVLLDVLVTSGSASLLPQESSTSHLATLPTSLGSLLGRCSVASCRSFSCKRLGPSWGSSFFCHLSNPRWKRFMVYDEGEGPYAYRKSCPTPSLQFSVFLTIFCEKHKDYKRLVGILIGSVGILIFSVGILILCVGILILSVGILKLSVGILIFL